MQDRSIAACRLEDRIMYSAVPGAEYLLLDSVNADLGVSDPSADPMSTLEEFVDAQSQASNDPTSEQEDPAERLIQQLMAVADTGAAQTTELVIVDIGVENYEQLVADLIDDSETRYEVFYIDENANGIDEVSTAIQSYGSLSAIHFLTHGSDGSVNFGNTQLNAASMDRYAEQIAGWGNALNADGDILLYGCNLAASAQGQDLLSAIGELCDCDIAASDDLTGHESLGGDWDLEFTVGAIESEIAFSTQLQSTWHGLLDISSGLLLHSKFDVDASDSTVNNFDGSLTNGASIDNNGGTNQIGIGKLDLDGSNDYVDLTSHVANFSGLSEGTISAWIKTSDSDGTIFSLNDSGDSDSGIVFYVWNGKLTFSVVDRGNYSLDVVTNANIDDNVWHHVAITVDSSGNKLFIDGVKQNSLTYYDGSASTQDFFSDVSQLDFMAIGAQKNSSSLAEELEGFLDDVRVYDRGLSSDDISDLFSGNSTPVLSGANNLTTINEDDVSNSGTLVSALISGHVTDADVDAISGIAVTAVDNTYGTWQYTLNGGSNWTAFSSPTDTSARLLTDDASTLVRFVPNADWNGTVTGGLTFHAWDQTTGANGGTGDLSVSFSSVGDEFSSSSYNRNDGTASWSNSWQELAESDGATSGSVKISSFGSVVTGSFLDIEPSAVGKGVLREVDLSNATSATLSFTYEQINFSSGGQVLLEVYDGSNWTTLQTYDIDSSFFYGSVGVYESYDISTFVAANTQVRFRTTDAAFGDHLRIDDLQVAYTSANQGFYSSSFSAAYFRSDISVTSVNDVPVASNDAYSVDEDGTLNVNWWNTNWQNRQQITFDNTSSAENLTDVPVLLSLSSANVDFDKLAAGGADIRFLDADGTVLAYEIESWDDTPGSESATVWVNVPQIDAGVSTDYVWMYFNNSAATDAQNPSDVWTSETGVWHLDEDPGPGGSGDIKDSDAIPNNGTAASSMTTADLVAGKIGNAIHFDGSDDFIDFTSTDVGDNFTIEVWVQPDAGESGLKTIVANSPNQFSTDGFRFFIDADDGSIKFETGNGSSGASAWTSADAITFDAWNHVAVSVDRASGLATIYVNGANVTIDQVIRSDFNTSSDWEIGRMEGSFGFSGVIDELRISNSTRSAESIEASYLSQNGSFAFANFGSEEQAPGFGGVLQNDSDVDADLLILDTIPVVDVSDGTLVLNKDGTFIYTPDANFAGTDSFTYNVSDGNGAEDTATVTITVNGINEAPVNTLPGTQSVAEEIGTSISGISIVDVDAGGSNVTTQLQVSAGLLNVTVSGDAWISSGANGTSDLTIEGTVADINASLASLIYTGNADVTGVNADSLTVTTDDLGNTGAGGALQDIDAIQIDITAVNDAPVVVGPGLAYTVNEQENLSIEGTGFSVSDADASSGTMTATITVGEGWITVVSGNSGATISSGNGTGTVVLTGTLSEIDSLLTGAGTGTIRYNNGSESPSSSTTITVIVNDGGNTGADPGLTGDGWSEEGYASQTINITALNDDPTNGGSLASDVTILEDVTTDLDLSLVDILDVDAAASSMTVTLSVSSGVLDAATGSGVTITGSGSNVVTLDGTIGDLNNYLNTTTNIQYTGALNVNGDDADVLTFTVNDNGNTGAGGGTPINFGSMNIDLTAVNDDPVNIGGLLPSTVTLVEDVAADLDLSAMVIDDVDVLAGSLTITMMTTSGAVLSTSGGSGVNFSGSGTSALNVWGTIAELNSFIADSTSVQLQGATGAFGLNADQVTFMLTDNGNTGLGGGGAIVMGVINVDINPVNDAAVSSNLESTPVNYTENDGPVFLTNLITFNDVDDTDLETATVQITGNYVNGEDVLAFVDTANISGSFDAWSGKLTLSGTDTIANYQAAIRSVTYENNSDEPSVATRTVEWIINDGDDDSVEVSRNITITAVDDASVLSGIEIASLDYTENDGPVSVSSTIWVSDFDDANIESAQIVISGNYVVGEDALDFSDTANITAWFNSLTGTLTLTGSDTLANYEAALKSVTYENLSENPSAWVRTVSFTVNDGDVDSNTVTRNITVTPVNDAPIANADGPIVRSEASSFTLTPTSNDIDMENGSLSITAINGNAIVAGGASLSVTGGLMSLASDGFTLTFTPFTNAYGDADFTYTITDGNGLFGTATVDLDLLDTRTPDMPIVTLLEDANHDGFINIAEQVGALDLLITLPVSAVEGESLSINGVVQILSTTDVSNGFVATTLPAPAHNDTVSVSVYLFDPAGNASATNVAVAYADLEAPLTVGALDLLASSDGGHSNSDNYTSDTNPTFRLPAGTGEPGALVRVFADGVEVGVDYVNPDGSAEITATINSFQIFKLTYTFTDAVGNESPPSIGLFVEFFDGALPYAPPANPEVLGVENVEPPVDQLVGLPGPSLIDADVEEEEEKIPFLPSTFQTTFFEFEETQTERIAVVENGSSDLNLRRLNQDRRDLGDIAISTYSGDLSFRVAETPLTDDQSYAYQLDSLVKRMGVLGDELREELSDISLLAGTAKAGATVFIAGYVVWGVRAAWVAGWVATSIPTFTRFDPLALLDSRANAGESLAQIAKGKKS